MEELVTALTSFIPTVLGSAATEASKSAWTALTALVRRRFGPPTAELLATGTLDRQTEIVSLLHRALAADEIFAGEVAAWYDTYRPLVLHRGDEVSNVIGGTARVRGSVVQGRDIGSITFGNPV